MRERRDVVGLVNEANQYTSVLPDLNLRGRLADRLQLRFAASKNISRPDFNQLNPSLTITEPGTAPRKHGRYMRASERDTMKQDQPTTRISRRLFLANVRRWARR
ncbi:outer membrane beta-barrel protein [Sphingomonas faeni]|uniref:outer membrane beta-barrel protein n=1 Tax=Sphingomonas faeni TaxID=185950 RepID=UPI00277E142D|nr:outer membrane beta-barrel protein [Sphingomonas faeni]MDQ0837048.1 hypothetical protein [Sphingomonas faeni]